MKKLLKLYDFRSIIQYYEMIADSFVNGQQSQAKEQYLAMPRKERIAFLHAETLGSRSSGMSDRDLSTLFYLEINN